MGKCRSGSLSSTVEEKQVKLRHYLLIEEKTAAEPKLLVSGDTRKKKISGYEKHLWRPLSLLSPEPYFGVST